MQRSKKIGYLGPVRAGVALGIAALAFAPPPVTAGTLEDVTARGRLVCGVSEGLRGFSLKDESGVWQGFDVDFCRAVAAAVLGDAKKVDFVPLSTGNRFDALAKGDIDLLSRNSTWTMSRDVAMPLEFVAVSYFDGQGFLIPALYGATSPLELSGASICVLSGTTTEQNAAEYFRGAGLQVTFVRFDDRAVMRAAYEKHECDAYSADRSALAAERSLLADPDDHVIMRDVISKEPLGPVARDDDPRWINALRWTLYGMINAEELAINSYSVTTLKKPAAIKLGAPAAKALALSDDWLVRVIESVGNYGEVFARNLGIETPLELSRGLNAQWTQGGLLYAPPME